MIRSRTPFGNVPTSLDLEEEVEMLTSVEETCDVGCRDRHPNHSPCLVCGEEWRSHNAHVCRSGERGRFPTRHSSGRSGTPTARKRRKKTPHDVLGNKRPLCGGSCLASEDSAVFIIISIILFVPLGFFLYTMQGSPAVQLVALALSLGSFTSGLFAVLLDPGVVPAQHRADPPPLESSRVIGGLTLNEGDEVVMLDGMEVVKRWCSTCGMHRPLRAAHCPDCDVCVDEFDHHCPVIGSCVGQRTFRFFAGFLWCTALLSWWVVVFTGGHLAAHWPRATKRRSQALTTSQALQIVLLVYSGFIGLCVGVFGLFYCSLTCSNLTERESLRNLYGKDRNPWHNGYLNNWWTRILGPIPPSQMLAVLNGKAAVGVPHDVETPTARPSSPCRVDE